MPTQGDFERAAGEFDRSAVLVDEMFLGPHDLLHEGVLVGGLLTIELSLWFDHLRGTLRNRADDLRDLAATCRRRAETCAAYQAALGEFDSANDVYEGERRRWAVQADAHALMPDLVAAPGPAPRRPEAPPTPPDWVSANSH
ncbi:MAG: hypothetical protein ABI658_04040 [Acidimicrobiales bacterium]